MTRIHPNIIEKKGKQDTKKAVALHKSARSFSFIVRYLIAKLSQIVGKLLLVGLWVPR